MNRQELEACLGEPLTFRFRKIAAVQLVGKQLFTNPNRLAITAVVDNALGTIIEGILALATIEEQVHDYPADWWQAFKERWFPEWLKQRYPVRHSRVWAVHMFPELNVPPEYVGKEYVTFRVVDEEKLRRKIDAEEDSPS